MAAEEPPPEEVVEEPKSKHALSPCEYLVLTRNVTDVKIRLAGEGSAPRPNAPKTSGGNGPLHCAVLACQTKSAENGGKAALEILDALLESDIDINAVNDLGRTALHLAVLHCVPAAVKRLTDKRANEKLTDGFGQTPADYARTLDVYSRDGEAGVTIRKNLRVPEAKRKVKTAPVREEPSVSWSLCPSVPVEERPKEMPTAARVSTLRVAAASLLSTNERDKEWIRSAQLSGRGVHKVIGEGSALSTVARNKPEPRIRDEPVVMWSTDWPVHVEESKRTPQLQKKVRPSRDESRIYVKPGASIRAAA